MGTVVVSKTIRTKWKTPGYESIVRDVLGSDFSLSIVLIGDALAEKLNTTHRNKMYPANVLTFPLTKSSGEIFLNIAKIRREARRYESTPSDHAKYLLIHGCLHLKGYTHGSTMDTAEDYFKKRHNIR